MVLAIEVGSHQPLPPILYLVESSPATLLYKMGKEFTDIEKIELQHI